MKTNRIKDTLQYNQYYLPDIIPFNDDKIENTLSPRVQEDIIQFKPTYDDITMTNLQKYTNLPKAI